MEQLLQDLRFGTRILWKSPGLSATAAILIALVIGGNTTVFSMIHAFMTRPAPGIIMDGLVSLRVVGRPGEFLHPLTDYLRYEGQTKTLVTPTDGRTYVGVFLVLACAPLIACYLPARRASRVDPLVTLRYD